MKKHSAAIVGATVILAILAALRPAQADYIPMPLAGTDFDALGMSVPASPNLVSPVAMGSLVGQMVSQAFTDNAGDYLYLYQVKNTGTSANSYIETFTVDPMIGANANTTVGYLTANAPAGFTLGTQAAAGATLYPSVGPTISFSFPGFLGYSIPPGVTSQTLYVRVDEAPGQSTGNLIDGSTAQGVVVAPVPEPCTLALLGVAAASLLAYACRRRKPIIA